MDILETGAPEPSDEDGARFLLLATKLKDAGTLDLMGMRDTKPNLLHELEKHQLFVEHDQIVHDDGVLEVLSARDQEVLVQLRQAFPSDEDIAWHNLYF